MPSRLTSVFLCLTAGLLTACSSASLDSASTAVKAMSTAASPASGGGFTTVSIGDPSLNDMKAMTFTIPAGWKLQGVIVTGQCTTLPWQTYRAYSPDGLSEMRMMPAVGWRWAPNPRFLKLDGCMPFSAPLSAEQFLDKYIETIPGGVHVVGTMPVDGAYRNQADQFAARLNAQAANFMPAAQSHYTDDVAALRVETLNGSFVLEQRIRVAVQCAENDHPGMLQGGNCFARVDVLRAPKGKLDALVRLMETNNLPKPETDQQWAGAVMQRERQRGQAALDALNRQFQASSAMLRSMHEQFMATSQHNHEAFMAQQESSFRSSMNNSNANMAARSAAASDWVDYALDRQTVTGSGGPAKISNAYSHTWSNGQGQWYQTNDPNANPNGALTGSWTEQTKIHGDGQPY